MADIVQTMLQEALGDAARSTKFGAFLHFSTSALEPQGTDIYMHVKTSMFPGKSHEPYDLRFKGRSIPVRGQVKYDNTWTCSFYLTENHELKLAFEDWIESLDQTENMDHNLPRGISAGQAVGTNFSTTMMLAQMDFTGDTETAMYQLHNVFPKNVSSVPVDYSSTGTILEFTVDFSYSHYTAEKVGGVKLPAKTGGGPDIPGVSAVSTPGAPNFSTPGSGGNSGGNSSGSSGNLMNQIFGSSSGPGGSANIGGAARDMGNSSINSFSQAGIQAGSYVMGSITGAASSGDFSQIPSDFRNISTNFAGAAKGVVIDTFNNARGAVVAGAQQVASEVVSRVTAPVNRVLDSASRNINKASKMISKFKF